MALLLLTLSFFLPSLLQICWGTLRECLRCSRQSEIDYWRKREPEKSCEDDGDEVGGRKLLAEFFVKWRYCAEEEEEDDKR